MMICYARNAEPVVLALKCENRKTDALNSEFRYNESYFEKVALTKNINHK